MKGSSFLPLEIGIGKQFHPNLYIGVRSGAWVAVSDKATAQIPIMSDFKVMFPSSSEGKLKPIINARFGYLLNTEGGKEIEVEDGEGGTITAKSESVDMIVMELMPGVQIPTTKNSYFEFKLGYNISSNVKAKKVADFENDVYVSTPSKNMSYGFFSIGFTHTLGKRGARL